LKRIMTTGIALLFILNFVPFSHALDYVEREGIQSEMASEPIILNAYYQWGSITKL
jgi:hypothetical protein